MTNKSYSELVLLPSFEERLEYLKLGGAVGKETFGFSRYLNQILYGSSEWKRLRNQILLRDNCCDLGVTGFEIILSPIIHHINPITYEDVVSRSDKVFDPDNLITVSFDTHQAIHFGSDISVNTFVERKPNDTIPWR